MTYKNKLHITKKKAFTLIELLIVIAIIGILFIVLVSKVDFATDKAKATGVQTDFRSFQLAFNTVAQENAGFNTFGWDTGDLNQDGIRNSYDEGDTNKDGVQNGTEVFTGHKVYAETFSKVFSLKKAQSDGTLETNYDRDALNRLETAINANLDPKLHITIKDDGEIVMANGAKDPWNKEYHGWYITNAEVDKKDRGAIVMYSDGANNEFGSEHSIANGVVTITVPGSNKAGKDDYSIVSIYTYVNGYGEVKNLTTGFSNNQTINDSNDISNPEDNTPVVPDIEQPDVMDAIKPGLYNVRAIHTTKPNYTEDKLLYTWDELVSMGVLTNEGAVVSCIGGNGPSEEHNTLLNGSIVFPGSIKEIPNYAMYKCSNIYAICLQEGTEIIGESAFSKMSQMDQISVPTTLKEIKKNAFYDGPVWRLDVVNFESWANVDIAGMNSHPLYLDGYLYVDGVEVSEVTFPDNMNEVKQHVLDSVINIKTVHIPDHYTKIGPAAFNACGLTSIELPASLQEIGSSAFAFSKLQSIVFPNNDIKIGGSAFAYSALTDIQFGTGSYTFGQYVFARTKVQQVNIPSNVAIVGDCMFKECDLLETVNIAEGVQKVSMMAFDQCTSLKNIVIPESVTTIGYCAFNACTTLETAIIYSKTLSLEAMAFYDCSALKFIEIYSDTVASISSTPVDTSTDAFEGFYVKPSLVDAYKNNSSWKSYKDLIFAIS